MWGPQLVRQQATHALPPLPQLDSARQVAKCALLTALSGLVAGASCRWPPRLSWSSSPAACSRAGRACRPMSCCGGCCRRPGLAAQAGQWLGPRPGAALAGCERRDRCWRRDAGHRRGRHHQPAAAGAGGGPPGGCRHLCAHGALLVQLCGSGLWYALPATLPAARCEGFSSAAAPLPLPLLRLWLHAQALPSCRPDHGRCAVRCPEDWHARAAWDGSLNLHYGLPFGATCCAASLVGVLAVSQLVRRSGKVPPCACTQQPSLLPVLACASGACLAALAGSSLPVLRPAERCELAALSAPPALHEERWERALVSL